MSQDTIRLHLNTADSEPLQFVNGVAVDALVNNADTTFNLTKCGVKAKPDQALSASLIKATLPIDIQPFGNNYQLPLIVLKRYPSGGGAAVTYKFFSYNVDLSGITGNEKNYYQPFDYSIGRDQIIGILNTMVTADATDLFQKDAAGFLSTEATVDGSTLSDGYAFETKYWKKGGADFSANMLAIAQRLGLDTTLTAAELRIGNGATITPNNGLYKMTTYQAPLLVITDMNLNSVGSLEDGTRTNILSSIPIDYDRVNATTVSISDVAQDPEDPHDPGHPHLSWYGAQIYNSLTGRPWEFSNKYTGSDGDMFGIVMDKEDPDKNNYFTMEIEKTSNLIADVYLYYNTRLYGGARWYHYKPDSSDPQAITWFASWDSNFTNGATGVVGYKEWQMATAGANWENPAPMSDHVESYSVENTNNIINKINYHVNESHKMIDDDRCTRLKIKLLNPNGTQVYTTSNIYYEIEFKVQDAVVSH